MSEPREWFEHQWEAWAAGDERCPYCVALDLLEWACICDCWMADDAHRFAVAAGVFGRAAEVGEYELGR